MSTKSIKTFPQFMDAIDEPRAILAFHAPWCSQCKVARPKFDELSNEIEGLKFYTLDIDECTQAADECGVTNVPAFMIFENGTKKYSHQGGSTKLLEDFVRSHVPS